MTKLLQTLFFMSLFLMLANQLVHSQDATYFNFNDFTSNTRDLTYQGGVHVPPNSNFLRLTETDSSGLPKSWTAGRVLYSRPVKFWERWTSRVAFFETTITFRIKPSQNGAADGLAFFIAPVNTTIPSGGTGPNLGIFGSSGTTSSLFAVEFDNYVNEWDPNYRHIGIDIESRLSKKVGRFDSATGQLVTARISYGVNSKTIIVDVVSDSQATILYYDVDLKTILPEEVQVGISSGTGQTQSYLGVHDVISWTFESTLMSPWNVNYDEKTYIRKYMGE